jgi:hypothetical protein
MKRCGTAATCNPTDARLRTGQAHPPGTETRTQLVYREAETELELVSVHFSLGGRPRGRGFKSIFSRSATRSVQSSVPNGRPLRSDFRTAASSASSCTPRTLARQRRRRSASFAPNSSHSGKPLTRGVGAAQPVVREARPTVVGRIRDHPGQQRVRLDVPQHDEQVRVSLDDGALESALPDVPRGPGEVSQAGVWLCSQGPARFVIVSSRGSWARPHCSVYGQTA